MSELRLVDIKSYIAIANAYKKGKASSYNAVAEYVALHHPDVAELWSDCAKKARDNRILACSKRVQKHLACDEKLIDSDNTSSWLTEAGRKARLWAIRTLRCLSKNEPPGPSRGRVYFALATHHIFEWAAIPEILTTFLADDEAKYVDVRIRQVQNILEGINLLRDKEVHAVLDAVDKSITFPEVDRKLLDFTLKPVVLVPKGRSRRKAGDAAQLSLQEVAEKPLAYVHMPEEIGRYMLDLFPTTARVRVSTMAAVVRLVEECKYAGFAVNWKTLLGPGYGKRFLAHHLESVQRSDDLSIFTRRDLKDTPQKAVVECFQRHVVNFVNGKSGRSQLI